MSDPDTTVTLLRRDALQVPSLTLVVRSPASEQQVPLTLAGLVVGSGADGDVVIDDPQVSRLHCRLQLGERGIVLRDLGSKNGTFVRGLAVVETLLPLAEPVAVGSSRLEVQLSGAPSVVPLTLGASFGAAIGGSIPMRALFAQLERAAASDATVLMIGETGTGKELLAHAIHQASPRREGPFEVLDCAAVSPDLLEGELFGWVRGAFTGAEAAREGVLSRCHGGTLFVDELGELPLALQPKLLRALEARHYKPIGASDWQPFDARIVCATHRDLRARVKEGSFREDLYYRIAMVEVRIPPLRERKQDIPLLVERMLAPRSLDDLPPGAMALLLAHDWPGNVRELANTVTRLLIFPDLAQVFDASPGAAAGQAPAPGSRTALDSLPLREARALVVEHFEREYIASKLRAHAGNVSRAASAMGVSRQFLHRLLERYSIGREDGW